MALPHVDVILSHHSQEPGMDYDYSPFSRATRRVGTQPRSVYNFHPAFYYTKNTRQNVFDRLNKTLFSAGLPNAKAGCAIYASAIDIENIDQWKEKMILQTDIML